DKLEPGHLERLYSRLQVEKGLKPATVHLVHRTFRVALNEAVRRKRITDNPAKVAKPPRVVEEEIVPFTVEEAQRIFDAAGTVRNGARFVIALALGLRRGEELWLKWDDIAITWQHGCRTSSQCRQRPAQDCARRRGTACSPCAPGRSTAGVAARLR